MMRHCPKRMASFAPAGKHGLNAGRSKKQQRTVFGLLLFLRKSPAGYFRPPSREKKPKVMGQTMLAKPIARKYSKK